MSSKTDKNFSYPADDFYALPEEVNLEVRENTQDEHPKNDFYSTNLKNNESKKSILEECDNEIFNLCKENGLSEEEMNKLLHNKELLEIIKLLEDSRKKTLSMRHQTLGPNSSIEASDASLIQSVIEMFILKYKQSK